MLVFSDQLVLAPRRAASCTLFINLSFVWRISSFPVRVVVLSLTLPPLGVHPKPSLEFQRISIDRSKLSEDEAFEHAIEMISSRQMGFRKAADFFQVSKWKLYKTARKRGIYAEIKKQNQAHVSRPPSPFRILYYTVLNWTKLYFTEWYCTYCTLLH